MREKLERSPGKTPYLLRNRDQNNSGLLKNRSPTIKWSEIFKLLEKKIHQARILYPEKLLFKHKVSHEEIYHQQTCSAINVKKKKKKFREEKKIYTDQKLRYTESKKSVGKGLR